MKRSKGELVVYIVALMILGIFSYQLQHISAQARTYPLVMISFCFLMIAILLVRYFLPSKKQRPVAKRQAKSLTSENTEDVVEISADADSQMRSETELEQKLRARRINLRVFIYMLAILLYLVMIEKFGYVVSTVLFGVYSLWYLKNRSKLAIALVPIVIAVVMYLAFTKILMVPLPAGDWITLF